MQRFAQQAAVRVAAQQHQAVAQLIGDQHETPVRRDGEFPWFATFARAALDLAQRAVGFDGEGDDVVVAAAVADIEEVAIGRCVDRAG